MFKVPYIALDSTYTESWTYDNDSVWMVRSYLKGQGLVKKTAYYPNGLIDFEEVNDFESNTWFYKKWSVNGELLTQDSGKIYSSAIDSVNQYNYQFIEYGKKPRWKIGKWVYHHKNGQLKRIEYYDEFGRKQDTWKYFDTKGQLRKEKTYSFDTIVAVKHYQDKQ